MCLDDPFKQGSRLQRCLESGIKSSSKLKVWLYKIDFCLGHSPYLPVIARVAEMPTSWRSHKNYEESLMKANS